jgi:hypothetical protein
VDVLYPPVLLLLGFAAACFEAGRALVPEWNDLLRVANASEDE